MPNASAASEAQQWQWERCRWLHVAPCTCEVSREWCVWVQPALNARIHFSPRFKKHFTTFDSDISFLYLANPSQSHRSHLIKPAAQRSGRLGPFPWAHRTISILHPRLTSRGMRAQRPLKVATEGIGRSGRTAVLAPLHASTKHIDGAGGQRYEAHARSNWPGSFLFTALLGPRH